MKRTKRNIVVGLLMFSMLLGFGMPIKTQAAAENYWMLVQGGDYRNEADALLGIVNTVTVKGNKLVLKGRDMNTFKTKDFNTAKQPGKIKKKTITLSKSCKYYISVYDKNGEDKQKKVSFSKFKKALRAKKSKTKPHGGKNQPDGFLMVHVKGNKAVEVGSLAQFQ